MIRKSIPLTFSWRTDVSNDTIKLYNFAIRTCRVSPLNLTVCLYTILTDWYGYRCYLLKKCKMALALMCLVSCRVIMFSHNMKRHWMSCNNCFTFYDVYFLVSVFNKYTCLTSICLLSVLSLENG